VEIDLFFLLIMHITWHGLTAIRLQTKETQILIDPYQASTGLKIPGGKG